MTRRPAVPPAPRLSGTILIVFAKAPVAGQAKTRLIPALGAPAAAALAERLLHHTMSAALMAGFDDVELCVAPTVAHAAFARYAGRAACSLSLQGDSDLGARMDRALTRALARHRQALLIGTDAPALDATRLRAAAQALMAPTAEAVFVPAHDGGYALVGLRRPAPELFAGMTWSTPGVMAETRRRATAAGLHWVECPPVHDIDEPADLQHLPPGLAP